MQRLEFRNAVAGGLLTLALLMAAAAPCLALDKAVQHRADQARAMILPIDPTPLTAVTATGSPTFKVEIADDATERGMGLMFREYLPSDHGMLFVFEQTRDVGFWMKNTKLPLDLIFIGEDGKVKAIRRGEPMSEAAISAKTPVRFVLELNAGTAAKRGIEPGVQIRHPQIDAVDDKARGETPD